MSRRALLVLIVVGACGPEAPPPIQEPPDPDAFVPDCFPPADRCNGNAREECVDGFWVVVEPCDDGEMCNTTYGCITCIPASAECDGDLLHICNDDGSGWTDQACEPELGLTCDIDTAQCIGPCADAALSRSYVGCEYMATVTGNLVPDVFEFAVALSNLSGAAADVTIDGGALSDPRTFTIPNNGVVVEKLPWVFDLKMCTDFGGCTHSAVFVEDGAYRIRSTRPIVAYQFSPLDYFTPGGGNTYTNDASLLLPVTALGTSYVVASYPVFPWGGTTYDSLLAVTGAVDETTVTITTTANVPAGVGAPAFPPGDAVSVTLNKGDVLELPTPTGDLTGTIVTSDKPVQVIGGHQCTYVPIEYAACDHLEENMFPVTTLGAKYVVTAPAVETLTDGKVEIVRVIAVEANTTITYDPPVDGLSTFLAEPGEWTEIENYDEHFTVTADKKVLVAQYMEGQQAGGDTGDPAMTLAVPVEQYRTDYLFHAPTNYEFNYVNVTGPLDAIIKIDSTTVQLEEIGSTGWGIVIMQLDNTGDGNHSAVGNKPFGIQVYGYGQYTSYWYPGGLDLTDIIIE